MEALIIFKVQIFLFWENRSTAHKNCKVLRQKIQVEFILKIASMQRGTISCIAFQILTESNLVLCGRLA